jgi:tetratricopeptide (TPR) repeat protein
LGTLASYSRDYKATGAYYEEAMTLAQQLGNLGLQALVASNLAFHYVRENKLDKARAFAEETIQLAQRINAPNFEDQASIPLTALALRHGNYALVEQLAIKQMARPSTDPQVMLAMVTMRSLAASGRGEFEAAKAHLRPAAPLIPEANAPLKSTVLWALVPIAAHAGDEKRAVELLRLQYQHTMMAAPDNEFAKPLLDLRKKLKGSLGEKAYKAAWERGAGLDIHAEYTRAVADYL